MSKALRWIRGGMLAMTICALTAAAAEPPDWVAQWISREPFARMKKYFQWRDVWDPQSRQMLSEAADDIAAFLLQSRNLDLRPAPNYPSVFAPGAEARFRKPPIARANPNAFWGGPPYAFTPLSPNRLGFLAFLTDPGERRGYIEGYVFERQPNGRWLFVCHLSGFPEWIEWTKGQPAYQPALGTRVPATSKPEC